MLRAVSYTHLDVYKRQTIDRFCKKLDFRGYKDIKIEILRYISSDSSGFLSGVDLPQDFENMSLSDLLNFVLGVNVETLLEIKNITTLESIERAINIITKSKCIILVGVGSSAPVVLDLEPVSYTHLDVYKRQGKKPFRTTQDEEARATAYYSSG